MSALSPGLREGVLQGAAVLCVVVWAAALSGCSGGGELESGLDDYLSELGAVTGVEWAEPAEDLEPPGEPLYPEPRTRRLEVEEIRVTPLSALSLRRCSLLSLVGERNSVLGRMQSASGRLRYEAMFVAAASACVEAEEGEGRGDGALAEQLRELIAVKARDLPAVFWNATFGSNEAARHFGAGGAGSAMELGPGDDDGILVAWQVLAELASSTRSAARGLQTSALQWRQLAERLEAGELDIGLETLRGQTRGGTLRALALLAARLDVASDVLEESRRLHGCDPAEDPLLEAELREIEQRYWQGRLGPQVEALLERTQRWLLAVDRSWREMATLAPASVAQYRAHWLSFEEGSAIEVVRAALLRHEEAWRTPGVGCRTLPPEAL